MSRFCSVHRLPRAGVDPIDSAVDALAVISFAMNDPMAPEIIAVLLDHEHCGVSILVVTGITHPDALFDVLRAITDAAGPLDVLGGVVLASVRPDGGLEPADGDRWLAAVDILDERGIELLEWLVIDDASVSFPREMAGDPSRWGDA
jgi:hypothetical protein